MQKKITTPPEGSHEHPRLTSRPWRKGVLASAALLTMLSVTLDAHALALGAISVRSFLGEPLRAEIEVPQISSEEAASFQATVASPEAFRAAGIEFTPALSGARVSLHRRPNGQAYLRLTGERPINEPFVGVVIEANWANGRVVRDYTMLVDPVNRAAPTAVVVTPPQASAPSPAPAPAVVQAPPRAAPAPRPIEPPPPPRATARPPVAAPAQSEGGQVTVRRGDTAYGIATAHVPVGVSLDQMLVAMLRANPDAFMGGNVNRMKAGAVLALPTSEQASATSRQAARRAVLAQSRDFQAYRRGLARSAPTADVAAADRKVSGAVQAQVSDNRAAPPSPDRLTLSKGGATTGTGTETQTARSRQAQEQSERVAELNKNLSELSRLQSSASAPGAAGAASAPAAPGLQVPTGSTAVPTASASAPVPASAPAAAASAAAVMAADPASAAASATDPQSSAADAASAAMAAAASAAAPAASAPVKPPVARPAPPPPPIEEPSFLDSLTEDPLLPAAGIGLLLLLGGYGLYRSRQRKNAAAPLDSSFIESRLQPDSFFGVSGGQRVNTEDGGNSVSSSSMTYSPSQLDAAGDVDPVAEADVYLAYGRDMQAEEILKEALHTHPGRSSIHRKLAEIYAKRRDARALEAIAIPAHDLTRGDGADWLSIAALGSELDPDNPLYKPGGAPAQRAPAESGRTPFMADTEPWGGDQADSQPASSRRAPLDLDLDEPAAPVATAAASAAALDAELNAYRASSPAPLEPPPPPPPPPPVVDFDLDLDFAPPSELPPASAADADPVPVVAAPPKAKPAPAVDDGMMEFDLEALSTNPDSRSGEELNTAQPADADEDPAATKLALAQEFHAIGDTDGARALVKEVIAESSGTLRAKAERFLTELS